MKRVLNRLKRVEEARFKNFLLACLKDALIVIVIWSQCEETNIVAVHKLEIKCFDRREKNRL